MTLQQIHDRGLYIAFPVKESHRASSKMEESDIDDAKMIESYAAIYIPRSYSQGLRFGPDVFGQFLNMQRSIALYKHGASKLWLITMVANLPDVDDIVAYNCIRGIGEEYRVGGFSTGYFRAGTVCHNLATIGLSFPVLELTRLAQVLGYSPNDLIDYIFGQLDGLEFGKSAWNVIGKVVEESMNKGNISKKSAEFLHSQIMACMKPLDLLAPF